MKVVDKRPSLFAAIAIGIGCMIGSGWLFASYYASRYAGPISLLSWIIGAFLALILALLLAEIATMYPKERGLLSRLITISHNRDYGFVIAISNWLGLVLTIPSEAEATIQYLSSFMPALENYFFLNHHLTLLGIVCVCLLMFIYAVINYWGIRSLAKANNLITILKVLIPIITAILLISQSFHTSNFTAYKHSIAPYGIGHAFSAVVVSGIFYAFYGFGMISVFGSELKNPKRNIPIALVSSVLICLIIYVLLQTAFIGALPVEMVKKGWHHIDFTSPLAQLLILLNLNFWAVVLYIDSAISPSGTGTIYLGSASRMLTGMSQDRQGPKYFDKLHPIYNLSRRSLFFTIVFCLIIVIFFRNWQKIVVLVTSLQLITCLAIPISFTKLRLSQPNRERTFKVSCGQTLSFLIYLLVSFLLIQAGLKAMLVSLILHIILFLVYSLTFYKENIRKVKYALFSSWSVFVYLITTTFFAYLNDLDIFKDPIVLITSFVLFTILYILLIRQKNAQQEVCK